MSLENVKVIISEDRMAAFVRLSYETGITMQDLRDALAREGVNTGISPAALREALDGQRGIFYQVAWGKKPEPASGTPTGRPLVVFKFAESQGQPPVSLESGPGFRLAWKRLRDRGAVSTGDVLAFVRNADRYPSAVAVTGEQVARIEFAARFRPGRNTSVFRDGTAVVASRPGIPYQDSEGLGVMDHVEVVGDVDGATGELAFPGDLSIRGNVQPGFRVSATGDILVSGNICGSATARGRIIVSGGINAPGEVVESGGGISCRFCENSMIRSAGGITVTEAVVHSVVETERDLQVGGYKGRIVGGLVRAALGVTVTTAGSPMGVPTVIEVGVSPKLRREQARMERELEKVRSDLEATRRAGGSRAGSSNDYDALRLRRMKRLLEEQEVALRERLKSFGETLKRLPKGYFDAGKVLSGVRLVMGADVKEFTSSIDRITMGVMPREAD
jgi:hypothetical protein